MIPLILNHKGFKLAVTGQAFVVGNLVAKGMAVRAIGNTFEMGMDRSQRSRGDLGDRRK